MDKSRFCRSTACLTLALLGGCATSPEVDRGVSQGAAVGALAGLVFGDGHPMRDAAIGAAVGAAGGAVVGSVQEGDRARAQQERDEVARAARAEQQQRQQEELQRQQAAEQELVDVFGEDTWEGYKALRACQHQRAYGLAIAGQASTNAEHSLAALWLEAIIAIDDRDEARIDEVAPRVIEADPDIDTEQQASIAADQVVLELRAERREMGMQPCSA